MCHQSVGLLQGAIEAVGISTISITVRPEITVNMRVPRAAYVRFPTGNLVGEPHRPDQQRTILRGVLAALEAIPTPGMVVELPYRWRRMGVEDQEGPLTPARSPAEREKGASPGGSGAAAGGDTGSPSAPSEGSSPDSFAAAQSHTQAIQSAYSGLLARIDAYRAWLQAEVEAEKTKPEPDDQKIQAFAPQLRYLAELQADLEGPTHDALVRVWDRAVRIRHWQEGVFL